MRSISELLGTIRVRDPASTWREVVSETRSLLDTDQIWKFAPRLQSSRWQIASWHDSGAPAAFGARYAHAVSTGPIDWAWFGPASPDPRQRNRVVEALSASARTSPGFFEASHLYAEAFYPLRLHAHRQLRVLVCDGDKLLLWFGAAQPGQVTERQRRLLQALVPALKMRAIVDAQLEAALQFEAGLDAALEQIEQPALLVDRRGTIAHANRAALAIYRQAGPQIREALTAALAGRMHPMRFQLCRVSGAPGLSLAILDLPRASIRERCMIMATRWRLSPRTAQVLARVVAGDPNRTIAQELGISTRAVELHVTRLLDAAEVASRAGLVARVLVEG